MSSAGWSEDRVTTLSKLWLDGLSAAQIARTLGGVTRNAVIGKVHRLGLSGRGAPSAPARAPRPAATRVSAPPRRAPLARPVPPRPDATPAAAPAAAPPPEGPGLVLDLLHLDVHACKWPIGDPKRSDFTFCGRRTNGRYCQTHERLSSRPGTAWCADRDPVVRRALAGRL